MTPRTQGSVRIVGTGLLGTSIGLALSKLGLDVILSDASPAAQSLAIDYGAGRAAIATDAPAIVIVCVPPDVTAEIVAKELEAFPKAVVTDVASVKSAILQQLISAGKDLKRYVGSHPMAGRERGGAASGRADLFSGRTWVISPNEKSSAESVTAIEQLAMDLGSAVIQVPAEEHDRAVALVSHLPQLVASLTAAQLIDAPQEDIALAGQGIRDTVRIAASDPKLWVQILAANKEPVTQALKHLRRDLDSVIQSVENIGVPGSLAKLSEVLERGNQGVSRLPGKHGTKATTYAIVTVMIDDKPGELARLFTEIGQVQINVEEFTFEHSPSSQVGLVEISVMPAVESELSRVLAERGWKLVG